MRPGRLWKINLKEKGVRRMKTRLKVRQVKELLTREPVISSVEEVCAVLNVDLDKCDPNEIAAARKVVERNKLRLQVNLKRDLYAKSDQKSKETLYKMICDLDELKRWGIKSSVETTNNISPTIVVKSDDPDIIDKVKQL